MKSLLSFPGFDLKVQEGLLRYPGYLLIILSTFLYFDLFTYLQVAPNKLATLKQSTLFPNNDQPLQSMILNFGIVQSTHRINQKEPGSGEIFLLLASIQHIEYEGSVLKSTANQYIHTLLNWVRKHNRGQPFL